ncbi:MAG: prepilin-type N-terminal cleavage/methylation domain-containing protein [SAR202 cluster bacterium]|nr:prepilin-type N-terminal cleavage/methylation domain-containing protein [SAR202 cluster bacterium]
MLKKTLGRGAESQKGFTLIELLVVVGIIVALAAVIVPLVIQFSGRGDTGAATAEWDAIQSAIDTMMADNTLTTVTAGAAAAFVTDALDFDAGAGSQTLAAYLRDSSTTYCYTWAASGRILTQVAAVSGACP